MSRTYDPYHLKSPTIYLVKNVVFLVIVALVGAILWQQILVFFLANPFINSLIALVAVTGIFLSFRQIMRLFPEIKWVNSMQDGTMARVRQPVLLAPVANMLRDRLGEAVITPSSMRSILDSVGNRLDGSQGHLALPHGAAGVSRAARNVLRPARNGDDGGAHHPVARQHRRRHGRDVREFEAGSRRSAGGHGHSLLGFAARPFGVTHPRLPRPAGKPGAERILHRSRGLDDVDDRDSTIRSPRCRRPVSASRARKCRR